MAALCRSAISPARRALLVMFICNHCPFVKHMAAGTGAVGQGISGRRAWRWSRSTRTTPPLIRPTRPSRWCTKAERPRLHVSVSVTTRRRKWPRRIARPARPISTCSTRTASWSIAGRWTPAGPIPAFPSPAKTCGRRSMRCSPDSPSPRIRSRASAATSNGRPGNEPDYFGHVGK